MSSLRELQTGIARAILHADRAARVEAAIEDGPIGAAQRLQIYRNNVFTSFTAALGDVYPVVRRLVGDGFFGYVAHRYIRRHPSRCGNLHEFGGHMADFLHSFPAAAPYPYLCDVARLEWAWHEVFHAADHAAVSIEELAALPAAQRERVKIALHPACRLTASRFPVVRIWEANQCAGEPAVVDLDAGPERALVWRDDLDVEISRLSAGESAFLEAIASGGCLARACLAAADAEPSLELSACLSRCIARRVLVDLRVD